MSKYDIRPDFECQKAKNVKRITKSEKRITKNEKRKTKSEKQTNFNCSLSMSSKELYPTMDKYFHITFASKSCLEMGMGTQASKITLVRSYLRPYRDYIDKSLLLDFSLTVKGGNLNIHVRVWFGYSIC